MKKNSLIVIVLLLISTLLPVYAGIITDGTIGGAGKLNLQGPDYDIKSEYGHQEGTNLFHSFSTFNIDTNESATFNGPDSVKNIITRITGNTCSQIKGAINSSITGANLYLMNPAGVIFGSDASINLTGSIHVSTADYLRMGNNKRFYTMPVENEMLSSDSPTAFGFLDNNIGQIAFESTRLTAEEISLIGGDIEIKKSALNAPGGRINIASVASAGMVIPTESDLDISSFELMGKIDVSENSVIDVSGKKPGEIFIYGGDFFVKKNSSVEAKTSGDEKISEKQGEGWIQIIASESVSFLDESNIYTRVWLQKDSLNSDNASDVLIEAKNISFRSGSGIRSETIRGERGGNVTLCASESVVFSGYRSVINNSAFSDPGKTGYAGDIFIETKNISFIDGGGISSHINGAGKGGDVTIIASDSIKFSSSDGNPASTIVTRTLGEEENAGNAGNILIETNRISLKNGGGLIASTDGTGKGGDIIVKAEQLQLDSDASIYSASNSKDKGGDAGRIIIGKEIELNGDEIEKIEPCDSITITDNSAITTQANNAGGGQIDINADKIIYLSDSKITSSVEYGKENGGDINIDPVFVALNNSKITAKAHQGKGGNIHITADHFIQSSDSEVNASSEFGIDGEVIIESPDTDANKGLSVLPSNFLDASRWMKTPCSARTGEDVSRFTATSGDGLPLSPDDWQPSPPLFFNPLEPEDKAEQLILNGEKLYYEGKYKNAAQTWKKALTLSDKSKETYLHTLICLANAYKNIGHHQKAFSALHKALPVIKTNRNSYNEALFLNTLGQLSFCSGKTDFSNSDEYSSVFGNMKNAETILEKALDKARPANDSRILAGILNNMGNVLAADRDDRDYYGAMSHYKKAVQLIENEPFPESPILKSKILINTARLSLQTEHYEEAITALHNILLQTENMPKSYNKATDLISAGILAMKIRKKYSQSENRLRPLAYQSLNKAKQIAENLQNPRIASYACGYLGQFYEQEEQLSEAIAMTRNAIFSAQQEYYPEILYLWQWQFGRLFKTIGNSEKAIASYRNAINTLNPVRTEFLKTEHGRFNKEVRPVYLELAELLLKQAQTMQDKENKLREARDIIEHLKTFEIEDFFKDECVTAKMEKIRTLDNPPSNTAVLYPISFSDHLVLLLTLPDSMEQVSVAVDSDTLRQNATRFHMRLKELRSARFQYYAEELYRDLIDPIENILISQEINTLIIAPDGVLRLIPFSALHDGSQYLVEKYALVTVPAITLTDSEPTEPERTEILLNGLSKASQGFPALPSVPEELEEIKNITGGRILQDEAFTKENLKSEFMNHEYTVVHMATHGKFGGTPRNSFLLTYNSRLTMDELEHLIGIGRFRDKQVNLLTLSACQTAQGDERSALGLAGVAVKAGVKSAIATLWFVDDKAASLAVKELYRQLDSGISKAKALQNTQKKLISHSDYNHPAYWAPFLLIGNWL